MPEVRTVPGHVTLGDLLDKAYLPGGLPCRVPPDEHRDVSTNPESLPTSKSLEWWFSGCGPGTHGVPQISSGVCEVTLFFIIILRRYLPFPLIPSRLIAGLSFLEAV